MAKEKRNQTSEILKYMQKYGSITSIKAIEKFGATRLSAIIFKLRKRGYDIETVDCVGKTRYGDKCTFAKYVLHKGDE